MAVMCTPTRRLAAGLLWALGMACATPSFAQQDAASKTPPGTPANDPAAASAEPAAQDAQIGQPQMDAAMKILEQAQQPKGIPVPDMPVVATSEVEGVKIEDMMLGDGPEIKKGSMVVAHYHGTLKDGGKVFDSSFERGEPAAFPLSGVIKGWQVGVPGMKVGGVRRLTIPSAMAYGEQGAGGVIGPNADLVFVVQAVATLGVEDIKEGEGDAASAINVAVTAFTMKDAAGNVIESADAKKPYIWIPQEFQPVNSAIEGMKVGGKRIVRIPKEFNKPNPMAPPSKRPTDVELTVEIELLALRNLQ